MVGPHVLESVTIGQVMGSSYCDVETLVVHFVEVEDGAAAVRWDQTLNDTEAVLCLRAIL